MWELQTRIKLSELPWMSATKEKSSFNFWHHKDSLSCKIAQMFLWTVGNSQHFSLPSTFKSPPFLLTTIFCQYSCICRIKELWGFRKAIRDSAGERSCLEPSTTVLLRYKDIIGIYFNKPTTTWGRNTSKHLKGKKNPIFVPTSLVANSEMLMTHSISTIFIAKVQVSRALLIYKLHTSTP